MAEVTKRVRLVFEDRRVLSKAHNREELNRCWIILKPEDHRDIWHFSDHLMSTFDLYDTCPSELILSIDGFVLPPFEPIDILRDGDVISVRKKRSVFPEILWENDEENTAEELDLPDRPKIYPHTNTAADEEFEMETGGYESESEEDEPKRMEDALCVEYRPQKKTSSKKRKASSKSLSSKSKKRKLATAEETQKDTVNNAHTSKSSSSRGRRVNVKKSLVKKGRSSDVQGEPEKLCADTMVDERKVSKSAPNSKRSSQREDSKVAGDLSPISDKTKKTPSRSARRKKAKRQWLREKAKLEKEEQQQKQLIVEDGQQSLDIIVSNVVGEHQNDIEEHQDDMGDEVVPVEVRPGHIRFEPLGKDGAVQPIQTSEAPMETFQWNGITSKKKGQKWGKEKTAYSKRSEQSLNQDLSETQTAKVETPANDHLDYEKLMPYHGLPKEGDVIAYRLIELSSSWTPEISSFRVGKISGYNPESKKVMLVPVPEYPIEKKVDEDDLTPQPDTYIYNENGSLEIEFSSLLDVRSLKNGSSNSVRPIINEVNEQSAVPEVNQNAISPSLINHNEAHTLAKVNGSVNAWEEISQALNAKKAEMSHEDGWNKKENSSKGSWFKKGLRGSALGPTIKYLRSQNEL